MAKNLMTIRTFLEIAQLLPVQTSILIRGDHGIGKSRIARKLARLWAMNLATKGELEFIDRRLSQLTEGDMIGLPSTENNTTKFNPPDWYMRACQKPCVLCLDELNRATNEVMQAAFQIILDRELNGWKLHPGTRVVSCVNTSSAYIVNEMDPALVDRFFVVDLAPDTQDWVAWAREEKLDELVIDFITGNDAWLDPPKNPEPGAKYQSRRSWEFFATAAGTLDLFAHPEDVKLYTIAVGYLGVECASAFTNFAKSIDNRIDITDVLNEYGKVKKKVKKAAQDKLLDIVERLGKHVTENLDKVDDTQGACLKEFMNDLPPELRITLWSKLTQKGVEKLDLAKSVHKWCAESIVTGVFGVPLGAKGVGVTPNIPSFLSDKK